MSPFVPRLSFEKEFFSEVDSTNNELIQRLQEQDLNEGFLMQAGFQSGGKGQGENLWESEREKNLLFSFVLRPTFLDITKQFFITIITSLALADTVQLLVVDDSVKIKWPNDIYVEDKKIAGVLIENAIQGNQFEWVVVGIGLNVNQQVFHSDVPNPVSLYELLKEDVSLNEVLSIFESQFARRYAQLQSGDYESLKHDYLASLYQYKEWKNYRSNNQDFRGRILGIDQYGFLRIETPDGEHSFDIKEVEYIG
jgi:BirA family biotin operon repressor/biotin-[acetyl-CoA-carboxylase] ligase